MSSPPVKQPRIQMENRNALNSFSFTFHIDKIPNIEFVIQGTELPGLTLNEVGYNNRFNYVPLPGTTIDWEILNINFIIDEDLENYLSIYQWIYGLGFPTEHADFRDPYETDNNPDQFSDIFLYILDNHNRPSFEIRFIDAFPVSLSGIKFDSTASSFEYPTAQVTFKYTLYQISNLKTKQKYFKENF